MYFVKYGTKYLHDPRTSDCVLLDLSLDGEMNSCGFCDFTIYPNHPMYNKLIEHDSINMVEVYDDNYLLFSGFIYELGIEFQLDGYVKCKGELAYLNESIVRPYSTVYRGYGTVVPAHANDYFMWLIAQHNAQVDSNKQFTVGIVNISALDYSELFFAENDGYPTTWKEISDVLLSLGGYVRIRHENGIRYIDLLSNEDEINSQILDFDVNLTGYTHTDDSDDIATFIIPLGANMSETEYDYDDGYHETEDTEYNTGKEYYTRAFEYAKRIDLTAFESGVTYYEYVEHEYVVTTDTTPDPDKEYFTIYEEPHRYDKCKDDQTAFEPDVIYYEYYDYEDESDNALSLAGLYDGLYDYADYAKVGDYIYCKSAVEKYGYIGITHTDANILTLDDLLTIGVVLLSQYVSPKRTIEVKAVDMHLINPEFKPIRIGEFVRVRSYPHKFDSYMLCTKIDLDLNNPEHSIYTLGTAFDTTTGEQNAIANGLNIKTDKHVDRTNALSAEDKRNSININNVAD